MSKPRRTLKGRPAFDDRGNASWQWAGESGSEIKTGRVRAIAEGLSLEAPSQEESPDPYNQALSQDKEKPRRRSLDDMRRLNDQMKREHADLVKRLRNRISEPLARVSGLASGMLLRLRFDDRELLVDKRRSGISIGRAEDNDIVLRTGRASRLHARIEIAGNKLILMDLSANGIYVQTGDRKVLFVNRNRLQLEGQGMIGFGRRPMQAPGTQSTSPASRSESLHWRRRCWQSLTRPIRAGGSENACDYRSPTSCAAAHSHRYSPLASVALDSYRIAPRSPGIMGRGECIDTA